MRQRSHLLCGRSDQILERMRGELRAHHNGKHALSFKDRRKQAADIAAEILRLERIEQALIAKCENGDTTITYRPKANPLAVLGIAPADSRTDEDDEDFG
jgi:hypothetical protein